VNQSLEGALRLAEFQSERRIPMDFPATITLLMTAASFGFLAAIILGVV
jgi:hypothetical protein